MCGGEPETSSNIPRVSGGEPAVVEAGPPVEEPPYPDPESDEGAELAEQLRYYELDDDYEYDYDYEPEPYDGDGPWDEEELRTGRWTHNHGPLRRRYDA